MLNISFPSLQRDAQDVLQDMFEMSVPVTRSVFQNADLYLRICSRLLTRRSKLPPFQNVSGETESCTRHHSGNGSLLHADGHVVKGLLFRPHLLVSNLEQILGLHKKKLVRASEFRNKQSSELERHDAFARRLRAFVRA